ncbi:MAG: GIY-YIG nuclease family protein [Candidatus Pacebacteria bacterium]|nr:GIY-YIG nuclease family protein [Candidatus Paceibacterota bacterium]
MYYVYVVKLPNNKLYIGFSSDLKTRIKAHEYKKDIKGLIYYEAYQNEQDARNRERQLKNFKSAYGHLKKRILRSIEDV